MPVPCPLCQKRALTLSKDASVTRCSCKSRLINYHRFPGYFQEREVASAAHVELEEDATCLHHPERKAENICDECGMFMCGLCQTDHGGRTLCLNCFSTVHQKELPTEKPGGEAKAKRYDTIALGLALLPLLLMWPVTIVTAPASIFMVIRHWKAHPYGIIPHSRFRAILALFIAILEIVGWVFIFIMLFQDL